MANRKFTTTNLYDWTREQVLACNTDECMLWPYSRHRQGYGEVSLPGGKKIVRAHRLAFFFTNGRWPTPNGRHTCDNPPCFNPRHVIEGTQADNVADTVERGRSNARCGESSHSSTLTEEMVRDIRATYSGRNGVPLAKRYGVSQTTISKIVLRKTWRHV